MRLLFVASRLPYPPIQGDRVRAYHQLRLLSQSHSITLVAPIQSTKEWEHITALSQFCERIEVVPVSKWWGVLRLVNGLFSSLPLQTLYYCDSHIQQKVRHLLHEEPVDLVHVQMARMGSVIEGWDDAPKVLDLIDALSLNWQRRSQREQWPRSWAILFEAKRLRDYERRLTQQFDKLIVSSSLDKQYIGIYDNIYVVPNGVDTMAIPFVENGRESGTIIFSGRMRYFPNADAAIYFAAQVFPLIRQQIAEARLILVGADPPRRIRRLSKMPCIEVTGYVPNLQDFLSRASVAVAPMRAGSGMQFKILEAMANGVPVVTTSYGLGGIEAVSEQHLLVAEGAEAFAGQVVRLLKDKELRQHLAREARKLVEEKYSWRCCVAKLEAVYKQAICDHPR